MINFKFLILLQIEFIINGIISMFVGSRPPFDFMPYGAIMLIIHISTGLFAIDAHQRGDYSKIKFLFFTFGCASIILYLFAQSVAYILMNDNNYYIRSISYSIVIFTFWFGEKKRYLFLKIIK